MSALDLLKQLPGAFRANAVAGGNYTIQFNTSSPAFVTLRNGACQVTEGQALAPDLNVTMADEDLVAMMKGELNGMTAFMTGKLQIEGDLMLAQRMGDFFDPGKLA